MDLQHLRKLASNLAETDLIEYLQGIRERYLADPNARGFSTNLHKMRQKISVLQLAHANSPIHLQFLIQHPDGQEPIAYWLDFPSNSEVFDVYAGIVHDPFVTFTIDSFTVVKTLFGGVIWKIKEHLDNYEITLKICDPTNYSAFKYCQKLLLDFTGILDDFGRYYWSGPRN